MIRVCYFLFIEFSTLWFLIVRVFAVIFTYKYVNFGIMKMIYQQNIKVVAYFLISDIISMQNHYQ